MGCGSSQVTNQVKVAEGTPPSHVIFVRHGERLDEADYRLWKQVRTEETMHDPPLTDKGREQAQKAGTALREFLEGRQAVLFASPASRTLTTAAVVAEEAGLDTINVSVGLFACASAASRGKLQHLKLTGPKDPGFGQLTNGKKVQFHGSKTDSFRDGLAAAMRGALGSDVLIIVTHREGIHTMGGMHGAPNLKTRYCSAFLFRYGGDNDWSFHSVMHEGSKKG